MPNTTNKTKCLICNCTNNSKVFPYSTTFNNETFSYLRCESCHSVFVSPIPNENTFKLMYSKNHYHDCFYNDNDNNNYKDSVDLLSKYVDKGGAILDYGCGLGYFLKELRSAGFDQYGVEFDQNAAEFSSKKAECKVWTVEQFMSNSFKHVFDAIHMGDVLEHLDNPINSMDDILKKLKHKGILFVEGPLEINASPVYFSILSFGFFKYFFRPKVINFDPPYHLIRVGSKQQLEFFNKLSTPVDVIYWEVYETGWPYLGGGLIKNFIAKTALILSGKKFFNLTFGNRFKAIIIKK